jgi:hypothetical protein
MKRRAKERKDDEEEDIALWAHILWSAGRIRGAELLNTPDICRYSEARSARRLVTIRKLRGSGKSVSESKSMAIAAAE